MISFSQVVVRYPGRKEPALDGASLDARPGRITAVVGPNGSGKSTLVRALIGRVPITSGGIHVGGENAASLSRRELATRVAVVTQREEPAFPLTVGEYVALGRYPHQGLFRAATVEDRDAVAHALELTDATSFSERAITDLSGGEWQRVRVARALAQGGNVIVLDEPTTFLDIAHEMALFELLGHLAAEGRTVLLVSHQLNLVARFAEHMVLLHRGRVHAAGDPQEVMQGPVLEHVYDWPLVVTRDPAVGAPALVPLRVRPRGTTS